MEWQAIMNIIVKMTRNIASTTLLIISVFKRRRRIRIFPYYSTRNG